MTDSTCDVSDIYINENVTRIFCIFLFSGIITGPLKFCGVKFEREPAVYKLLIDLFSNGRLAQLVRASC